MCQLRMKSVLEGHSHGMLSMSRANNQQRRIDLSWMTSENVSFWERRRSGHPNLRYISPTLKLTAWLIISTTGCVSQPPHIHLAKATLSLEKVNHSNTASNTSRHSPAMDLVYQEFLVKMSHMACLMWNTVVVFATQPTGNGSCIAFLPLSHGVLPIPWKLLAQLLGKHPFRTEAQSRNMPHLSDISEHSIDSQTQTRSGTCLSSRT